MLPAAKHSPQPPPLAFSQLLKERQQFNTEFPTGSPSSLGVASKFSKIQETDNRIVWSRPPTADATIPVVLFHHIMRKFIDDCANHQPTAEDNELVLQLTDAMSKFFQHEDRRTELLREILALNHIDIATSAIPPPSHGQSSKSPSFRTDGAIEVNASHVLILEVKGEIGNTGAEPYAQAILYYANSARKNSAEHLKFNFPCLIITVFGLTFLSSLVV